MTRDELISKLKDIEWDDFEVKEAATELPKNIWETVSAFSNASGGWIVLGVKQIGKKFEITGIQNGEKIESDFFNVVNGKQKLNHQISVSAKKYNIDGKLVIVFHIPSSPVKPIYVNSLQNTYLRSGSGDRRASEIEINAMFRDQAFGTKSEQTIEGASIDLLNPHSLMTYRNRIANVNPDFPYNELPNEDFCEKTGITRNGALTYGGLLMLGKRDAVQLYVTNFWIDMLEIPGITPGEAEPRYTFRMPEQENIWEYYNVLIQRLRLHVDAPFTAGPDGFAPDDNSELYALREGLVNMLAHADYFSPMHSTVRVFTNRIEFQNAGRFMFDLSDLKKQMHSMPRNPVLIKLFRFAKLSENAGYGIDKMLTWEKLTHSAVEFASDVVCSTVTYFRKKNVTDLQNVTENPYGKVTENKKSSQETNADVFVYQDGLEQNDGNKVTKNHPENHPENHPGNHPESLTKRQKDLLHYLKLYPQSSINDIVTNIESATIGGVKHNIKKLKQKGLITRIGPDKGGYWQVNKP